MEQGALAKRVFLVCVLHFCVVCAYVKGSKTKPNFLFHVCIEIELEQQVMFLENCAFVFILTWLYFPFCHQDALFFLKDFFTSLSTEVELLVTPDPEGIFLKKTNIKVPLLSPLIFIRVYKFSCESCVYKNLFGGLSTNINDWVFQNSEAFGI